MSKFPKEVQAPKNVELEAFADILDMMEEKGVTLVGFKGIDMETGNDITIPCQTFAHLIMRNVIEQKDFIRMMAVRTMDEGDYEMTAKVIRKTKPFGSTDS